MKTEAIGNGVSQAHESGVVGRQSGVDGDSFSTMLQTIFIARTKINKAPDSSLQSAPMAVTRKNESIDGKEGEAMQNWLAFAAIDPRSLENVETPIADHELTAAELAVLAEDPLFALLLQQWDDLPPAAQELAGLLLTGLLDDGVSLQGEQNTPGWLAELEMFAGAAAAKAVETDQLMQPGEKMTSFSSGDQTTVAKILQSFQGQLPQQVFEQLPEQKMDQLPKHLLEQIAALALPKEEIPILEKRLTSVAVPLLSEKGLSPQATALVASYLQEGKPLSELSPPLLAALREHLEGMELSREGESGEKPRPFEALLTRVEKFLTSLLSGGREETGSVARQFGDLAAEQQLKEVGLAGDRDSLPVLGENDSAKLSAVLGGRTEMTAYARSFGSSTTAFQPNEVMAQVMERLAMLARPGVQELRMQLHPEHLGNLMIKLRNVRGVLSAEILTQNIAVKELLEGQLGNLRQRFQDMNLQVEEFRVLVGDEEQEKRGQTGDPHKHPDIDAAPGLKKDDVSQNSAATELTQRDAEKHRVDYLA